MEMALAMDAGDILKQQAVPIEQDMTKEELEQQLLSVTCSILPEFLEHFDAYYARKTPQLHEKATYVHKITSADFCLCLEKEGVETLYHRIRAFSPRAYLSLRIGDLIKRVRILRGCFKKTCMHYKPLGFVEVKKNTMYIWGLDGYLEPLLIQVEGKKIMSTELFLRGICDQISVIL